MVKKKCALKIELSEGAYLPEYNGRGDSGMDVFALEDVIVKPGETVVVKTGVKMAIPEGYEIQVRPRSGISKNTKLRFPNSPGTIDSSYKGDISILVQNTSKDYYWDENDNIVRITDDNAKVFTIEDECSMNDDGYYHIRKGDKLAQFVLMEIITVDHFIEVEDVREHGYDRESAFGGSGFRKED